MKSNEATAEIFFTAFKTLKNKDKVAFLEKLLADPKLKEDIVDLALIEKARKTKGAPVSARDYFGKRRTTEKTW